MVRTNRGRATSRVVKKDMDSLKSLGDQFAQFNAETQHPKSYEIAKKKQISHNRSVNPKQDMVNQIKNVFNPNQGNNEQTGNSDYSAEDILKRVNVLEQRSAKIQDFCALQLSVFQLTLNTLSTSFNKNFEADVNGDKAKNDPSGLTSSYENEDTHDDTPSPMIQNEKEDTDTSEYVTNSINNETRIIKTEKNAIDELSEEILNKDGANDDNSIDAESVMENIKNPEEDKNDSRALKVYKDTTDKMQCLECPYKATTIQGLNVHIKYKHKTSKQYACPKCNYKSSRRNNLNTHLKIKHQVDSISHQRGRPLNFKPVAALTYENTSDGNEQNHFQVQDNTDVKTLSERNTVNDPADSAIENFFDNLTQVPKLKSGTLAERMDLTYSMRNWKEKMKKDDTKKPSPEKEVGRDKSTESEKKRPRKEEEPRKEEKSQINIISGCSKCPMCTYTPSGKTPSQTNAILKNHVKAVHEKVKDKACRFCDYRTAQKSNLNSHIKNKHGDK